MFDTGATSVVKTSALKHYMEAALEYGPEGTVNPKALISGALDAHSYDNFNTSKVSNQAFHHQPNV
jgi:hypothetical protein